MAIGNVRVQIDGSWYTLSNSGGSWKTTINAPGKTSFNQSGGYYPVTVEATNTAGTQTAVTITDPTVGEALKLFVVEKIPPVITINSPTDGAYVTNNQQPIVFNVIDEEGGSGVTPDTILVKLNGSVVSNVQKTSVTNGYQCTATPDVMADGSYTVTVEASDNDGNAAEEKTVTFKVDTVPPTLNITSPIEGLITAQDSLTVVGTTNDATSSPVTITITLNDQDQGTVNVGSDGGFTKQVSLAEGANVIVITATDKAGKQSSVTRNVTLDTSVPKITSVSIDPNPVDAGATMIISVVVE